MGTIKKFFLNLPLRLSFVLFVTFFSIIAVLLSIKTRRWAAHEMLSMCIIENGMDISSTQSSQVSATIVIYDVPDFSKSQLSPDAYRTYLIYQKIHDYAPILWAAICILTSSLLFYRLKLQKPIALLKNASSYIAQNNLSFSLSYEGRDEMSDLCSSFEKMRKALDDNNHEMIGMIEQRKRLNDAYTHELRTPVAVLQGYSDMILKYFPQDQMPKEELLNTVQIMSEHIARIDAFTDSMNTIQKLDDLVITPKATNLPFFLKVLENSASVLCRSQKINVVFQNQIKEDSLSIDSDAVSQVFENLLGNALRFAKTAINISCLYKENMLYIIFHDDGKGFSDSELKKTRLCYYSGKDSDGSYHFGLGLYIAALLCEKHGGKLIIDNSKDGGAFLTAMFREGNTR